MLMERSSDDDGAMSPMIREGLDHFLADLTRERESIDGSQHTMPLDVCLFCVQFLPSSYIINGDTEEEQHTQNFTNYVKATPPSSRVGNRCNSGGQVRSSLVIQHQFPTRATTPVTLGKSPRVAARTLRPRTPRSPPTYRLLSKDATRVLRIESPAASLGHEYDQHRANLAQRIARERAECLTGSANSETPHQNIIDVLIRGAGSLYTGAIVNHNDNNPPLQAPGASVMAKKSKIVTKKHGRHFKTELFFPAIPVHNRSSKASCGWVVQIN
ncbi:hypothetical protein PHMEG_00017075 [Phytophthora megakarya]|uniref:Uncharacterized protein n=1 Tax=Phytophthora megakarya TaxID=4795 RepID=A0A225VYA5_9STRA|nr:hypothetical protein PHMEG_00017075 [Phytophthora megakarya]